LEPVRKETSFYKTKIFPSPAVVDVCEVEVEPTTGEVKIVAMQATDDFGNVINPMIVAGQVHGGLVQGIGQALFENAAYDDHGQLLSGSYMDYCMPRADDVPTFTVDHEVTACTHNALGVKGCGEAGAIGSPPAVINAIVDALRDYGTTHIDMPATPAKIWNIVNQGTVAQAAE